MSLPIADIVLLNSDGTLWKFELDDKTYTYTANPIQDTTTLTLVEDGQVTEWQLEAYLPMMPEMLDAIAVVIMLRGARTKAYEVNTEEL